MKFDDVVSKYPSMNCEEMRLKMENKRLVKKVANQIRQITPRGEKEPCYVCGRYKQIAHLHHPFSVEDLTVFVLFYDLYDTPLCIPTVWLCPNHHALYHFVKDKSGCLSKEDYADISIEELKSFSEIDKMVKPSEILKMIKDGIR